MSNPRKLLEQYALYPKRQLGQNFLHDPNALQKIVSIADVHPNDTILEIGPGTGALTHYLAERARRVLAVEVDESLRPLLRDQMAGNPHVELYWMDFLDFNMGDSVGEDAYKVVANLPYYITSPILRKLLEARHKPSTITVMVQKQVAERMVAQPDDMSILSVSVQFYARASIAMVLKSGAFFPRPEVDSAVVHLSVYPAPILDVPDTEVYFEVVRAGFSQKRKQLKNSLSKGLALSADDTAIILGAARIDGKRRAETLSLEEWAALSRAFQGFRQPGSDPTD